MTIKSLVQSLLRKFGYELKHYHKFVFHSPYPVLPLLVREYLAKQERFFFIHVGANDGIQDDPLRELILEHQLPGLMIEPQPHLFEQLCLNYKDRPGLLFENVAISTEDGTFEIYCVAKGAPVPSSYSMVASFDKKHLLKHGVPAQYIERRTVPAVRLSTLLTKHGIDKVDLLQVDVEGFDYQIVRSALESKLLPTIIHFEHEHLLPRDRLACKKLLTEHSYRFVEIGKDTLAVRQD